MYVAVCLLRIEVPGAESLKDKRNLLRGLKQFTRQRFNVSLAEVGDLDRLDRGLVAACAVSGDRGYLEGQLQRFLDGVERKYPGLVADQELEITFHEP